MTPFGRSWRRRVGRLVIFPHCGSFRVERIGGEARRPCLSYHLDCGGQFPILIDLVMEHRRIPLPKWMLAICLMTQVTAREGCLKPLKR